MQCARPDHACEHVCVCGRSVGERTWQRRSAARDVQHSFDGAVESDYRRTRRAAHAVVSCTMCYSVHTGRSETKTQRNGQRQSKARAAPAGSGRASERATHVVLGSAVRVLRLGQAHTHTRARRPRTRTRGAARSHTSSTHARELNSTSRATKSSRQRPRCRRGRPRPRAQSRVRRP